MVPKKPDIFVSYSRLHEALVTPLVQLLRVGDRTIFQDVASIAPGDDFEVVIKKSLRRAKVVVVIWCLHAKRSRWVKAEYQAAVALKKPLIPVRIDHTPFPDDLGRFQAIDMSAVVKHEQDRMGTLGIKGLELDRLFTVSAGEEEESIPIKLGPLVPPRFEPIKPTAHLPGEILARVVMERVRILTE